jgi:peptide/nickel transport system substrate-binding protein
MAIAVQHMLKQVNIQAKWYACPTTASRPRSRASRRSTWTATSRARRWIPRPTPGTTPPAPGTRACGTSARRAWTRSSDKARGTRDEKELAKIYQTFQQYAVEDVPGVIAYVMNFANAYRKNVKGFRTHSYLWLDLRNTTVE